MRIPTWRLALTGGAIVLLLVVGVGLVAASASPGATTAGSGNVAAAPATSGAPDASGDPAGGRLGLRGRIAAILGGRPGPVAQHFVDGTLTFTDKDGNLVTIQLDHAKFCDLIVDALERLVRQKS